MPQEPVAEALHAVLRQRRETVAVAESLTGGLVGERLTAVPGASATFRGGVIAYATDLKESVLGVPARLLSDRGAVDPEVARAMAGSVRQLCRATYGLGLTGVAGPDPQDGKEPGTLHVAVAGSKGRPSVSSTRLRGDRLDNRQEATVYALDLLLYHLHSLEEIPGAWRLPHVRRAMTREDYAGREACDSAASGAL